MKKLILYNTGAQLLAKVVSLSLTAFSTILITRAFGKEGYGQFSIMQTLPALFYILSDFGLNATALKKINKDEKMARNYYATALALRSVLALFFVVALNSIVLFLPYSPFLKFGIFMSSFLIFTQTLFSGTNLIFQYKQRYDLSSIGYVAGSAVTATLVFIFIRTGLDVRFLSFGYVVGGIVTFAVNSRLLNKFWLDTLSKSDLHWNTAKVYVKDLLKGSAPLGLMFIFSQINFKADSILLSLLHLPSAISLDNISSVAIYALPYKIFEVSLSLPTFFMNATYPFFVKKYCQGPNEFRTLFFKTIRYLIFIGVVSSVLLYILAPLAVNILGGTQFTQSVEVLRILITGLTIFFITQPLSYFLVTLEKQKYLPWIYLMGAIFNVSANIVFIPRYSFYASAYITWLSEGLIMLLLAFFSVKSWQELKNERR